MNIFDTYQLTIPFAVLKEMAGKIPLFEQFREYISRNQTSFPYKCLFYTEEEMVKRYQLLKSYQPHYSEEKYALSHYPTPLYKNRYFSVQAHATDYANFDILSDYFLESQRMKAVRKDAKKSPEKEWEENPEQFLRYILEQKQDLSLENLREAIYHTVKECTSFKPALAFALTKLFKATNVLDFSAGWGDRMIGVTAAGAIYTGYDPNVALSTGHDDLKGSFRITSKIHYEPFETADVRGSFDLILTSPPYFDFERYSDDPSQSCVKYPELNDWLVRFLFPSLEKCWSVLTVHGKMVLHFNMMNIIHSLIEFVHWRFSDSDFQGVMASVGESAKPRPIWIWKKLPTPEPDRVDSWSQKYPALHEKYMESQKEITTHRESEIDWSQKEIKDYIPYVKQTGWIFSHIPSIALFEPPIPQIFKSFEFFSPQQVKILLISEDPHFRMENLFPHFDCGTCDDHPYLPDCIRLLYKVVGRINRKKMIQNGVMLYTLSPTYFNINIHRNEWDPFHKAIFQQVNAQFWSFGIRKKGWVHYPSLTSPKFLRLEEADKKRLREILR